MSLREWLDRPGRAVEAPECLHVFRQVAESVAIAHAQGVAVGSARPSCFVVSPPFARVAFIESASGSDVSGSCSGSDGSEEADPESSPPRRRRDGASGGEDRGGKTFPLRSVLAMELTWYTSPEEADDRGGATFASDVYSCSVRSRRWRRRCEQWRTYGTASCLHSCCSSGPRKHRSVSC